MFSGTLRSPESNIKMEIWEGKFSQAGGNLEIWDDVKFTRSNCDSSRSAMSCSNHSTPNPSLHDNLMRRQHDRDPMRYYEFVHALGSGSMGSVAKVKKRDDAVGGSSRSSFIRTMQPRTRPCFSLPFLGGILRFCGGGGGRQRNEKTDWTRNDIFQAETVASVIPAKQTQIQRRSSLTAQHTDMYYALKSIHLDRVMDDTYVQELRNEISILSGLDHPNIVRAIETFEYRNQLYMVLELCSGGDLYCRDPYSEDDAARIVCSILSAVEYMHRHNIVHRDLKYENVMFVTKAPESDVKIIDFGLSKKYAADCAHFHDGVGTIYTMAPEVMAGDYTSQADIWSIGVLAFMLLSSQMPFYGQTRKHVIEKILKCRYRMKGNSWKKVSPYAKGFVMELLQINPEKRPTAESALDHTWLRNVLNNIESASEEMLKNVPVAMQRYAGYSTLKKLALMVISHKSTDEEIGFVRNLFKKFESHGEITLDKYMNILGKYGYTDVELKEMFNGANLDSTGLLKYTEFVAATIEALGAISEERAAEAFDRLDSDDDGFITTDDLNEILGSQLPEGFVDCVIDEADVNSDHKISYEEFVAMWDSHKEETAMDEYCSGKRRSTIQLSVCSGTTEMNSDSDRESILSLPNLISDSAYTENTSCTEHKHEHHLACTHFSERKKLSVRRHGETI